MQINATFSLQVHSDLSALDYKVMALLYQPILGVSAHSMWMTLYQLSYKVNETTFKHQFLLDVLNMKHQPFIKARQQLEALNLLNVYENEDHYIYCLKTPLTPKQFLVDTIFGSYLKTEIGEDNIEILKSLFKLETKDLKSYINITKTFDELYEFKASELLSIDYELQGRKTNGGSHIKYQFDYETFEKHIPSRMKTTQLLTPKFMDQVTKIAFVYQLDPHEMAKIYMNAYLPGEDVTYSQLSLKASQYYRNNKQKLTIKEKDVSSADLLSKVTPEAIISKYAKAEFASMALQTASHLLERNQIDMGIINVALMFVLKHKDGELPNIRYMEIVLEDWLKKGVMTTEDALAHASKIESDHQQYEKRSYNKTQKRTKEPDWLDAYIKDIEKMEG
jgi:replication initiation and membrane attachment protein